MAYVGLILFLSVQARLESPLRFRLGDKVVHVIEYGVLGLLLARALRGARWPRGALAAAALAVALGAGVAAADELVQSTVPGRESSHLDWLADVAGLVIAQLVYSKLWRR